MAFSRFFPEAQKELLAATIKSGGEARSMGTQTDGKFIIIGGTVLLKPSNVFIKTSDDRDFEYIWKSFEDYDYIPVIPEGVRQHPNQRMTTTVFKNADGREILFDTRNTMMIFRTKIISEQYLEENNLQVEAAEQRKNGFIMRVRYYGEIIAYILSIVGCTT